TLSMGHTAASGGHPSRVRYDFPKDFNRNSVGRVPALCQKQRRTIMRRALISSAVFSLMLLAGSPAKAQVSFGIQIGEPPAPRAYRVPARPRGEFVWVEGYWYPQGN